MIRTQRLCSFRDESIVLSFDWDDVTGDVVAVRCVNVDTICDVHVTVQGSGTGRAGRGHEGTYAAGSGETLIAIPGGQRPRYPVALDSPEGEPVIIGYRVWAEV
jgi:hypothetical protein